MAYRIRKDGHLDRRFGTRSRGSAANDLGDAIQGCFALVVLAPVVMIVVGTYRACNKDKAEPDFRECERLFSKGDFVAAEQACLRAREADPESGAGKAADAKLTEIRNHKKAPPPPTASVQVAEPMSTTSCGKAGVVVPKPITAADWAGFTCKSKDEAATAWGRCLPGSVYSTKAEQACPGDKRCCPAR
jgi:hypothetical protein